MLVLYQHRNKLKTFKTYFNLFKLVEKKLKRGFAKGKAKRIGKDYTF